MTARRFELNGTSYKTVDNAIRKAETVAKNTGINFRYIIGSTDDGRFVPVCIGDHDGMIGALVHNGITVVA